MSSFMDKVQAVENKFMDLEQQISDPAVIARQEEWQKLTKEHASLMPLVETFRKYKDITHTIEGDQEILNDPDSDDDLMAMAKEEMNGLTKEQADLEDQLHILMLPKDPRDDKNVIMEIRGGAGGDEAALFAGDLFRMYMKYIEKQPGWKTSIISSNEPELGGFKEVVFSIEGSGVFGKLKYESGVHRVQRVPVTEAGGRIHTSTATVAVLPEAEDVEIDLNMDDVRVDYFRASGAGGQHVNKTSSAVRMTHIPTGIVVQCQNERSQLQNKEMCLKYLRAKLFELEQEKQEKLKAEIGGVHQAIEWGSQIRSYVFHPYNLVKDHRTNVETGNIQAVMDGDLDIFIEGYLQQAKEQKLSKQEL